MKHYITIALCIFLSQMCTAQVMMLFSQDSLTGIVSPLDVDSLFYWFAADVGVTDSLGGAIATDEGVGTWNDLSGNGYHVTQSTDGARPVWKATGGPGSKPTIQFDGTNDFLASAAHFWESDDLTIFVVMKFGNATRDAIESLVYRFGSTSATRQWIVLASNASASYRNQTSVYDNSALAVTYNVLNFKHTDWRLHTWINAGSGFSSLFTDGGSVSLTGPTGTGNGTTQNATAPLDIGAAAAVGPTNFLQGSISEIIVFSRALTATERTAIENYLNRKYDLY